MKVIRITGIACILQLCFFALITSSAHAQKSPNNSPLLTPETLTRSCVIHFKNGNKLTGNYIRWDKNKISVTSAYLIDQFSFSTKLIKSIELKNSLSLLSKSKHQATIQLSSQTDRSTKNNISESVVGEITAFNDKSVSLKTAYSDKLIIARTDILQIIIEDLTSRVIAPPFNLNRWESHLASKQWTTHTNFLFSQKQGHISTDAKLPNRTHIRFDLLSTSKKLNLWLYSTPLSDTIPSSYYAVAINNNSFSIQKVAEGQLKRLKKVWPKRRHYPSKRVKYDIYTDRNKGKITVYTDGVLSATYIDTELTPTKMGSHIHLISPRYPQTIRGFTIKKWSGVLPSNDDNPRPNMPGKGQNIYLANGDVVKGTILSISENMLKLRTLYANFKIPMHKITKIDPTGITSAPVAQQAKDLILYSPSNDSIAVQFISLKGTQLKVLHPILGKQTFDIRAFSRVRFVR